MYRSAAHCLWAPVAGARASSTKRTQATQLPAAGHRGSHSNGLTEAREKWAPPAERSGSLGKRKRGRLEAPEKNEGGAPHPQQQNPPGSQTPHPKPSSQHNPGPGTAARRRKRSSTGPGPTPQTRQRATHRPTALSKSSAFPNWRTVLSSCHRRPVGEKAGSPASFLCVSI